VTRQRTSLSLSATGQIRDSLAPAVRQASKPAVKPKNGEQLSTTRNRFVQWLILPPRARRPCTQKAQAEELGVHKATLSVWKHQPAFIAAVARRLEEVRPARDPKVWEATVEAANAGDERERQLYWEPGGKLLRGEAAGPMVPLQVNVVIRDG
jgi:hypothetical protein